MIVIIGQKSIIVSIFTLVIMLLIIPIAKKLGEEDYAAYEDSNKEKRRAKAYMDAMTQRDYADERKLFSSFNFVNKRWNNHYQRSVDRYKKATIKNSFITFSSSTFTIIISIIIAIIFLPSVKNGVISSGLYISIIKSLFELVNIMAYQFIYLLDDMIIYRSYMKDYIKFMKLEEVKDLKDFEEDNLIIYTDNNLYRKRGIASLNRNIDGIEFKNVSFTYPNNPKKSIDNFSYVFSSKKHYALVGENGAGKSTLVKLMLGIYKSYTGDIYINHKNLKEYSQSELNNLYSVVYQDFAKYQISLKDNILLGDTYNYAAYLDTNNNTEKIKDAKVYRKIEEILDRLDMMDEVNYMKNGIFTTMGKIDAEGIDLSGGQWQKVAIARSLISKANFFILDEPTSSLDPISEKKLYELYNELFASKTTVVVTHRLGNTKNCDIILVMEDGSIKETGNHKELIDKKGLYYEMFEKQRSWYDETEKVY